MCEDGWQWLLCVYGIIDSTVQNECEPVSNSIMVSQIDYAHSVRGGIGCWIFRRSKFSDVLCVGWVSLLSSVSSVRSADGGLLAVRSHQMTGWRTREPAEISVARLFRRVESVCDRNADISPSGRFPHRSLLYTVLVKRVRIRDRALASFLRFK